MNVQSAVRQQLAFWHGTLDNMLADCNQEALHKKLPGSTADSIAAIYAHIVFAEDVIPNVILRGQQPLYQTDGWEAKTGLPFPGLPPSLAGDWAKNIKMDLPKFQEYGKAVAASLDEYLANLPDSELERKVKGPFGEGRVDWVIATILGTHLPGHAGEIAALKGVQGMKGLPF